ncbi:MAG: hypothetical protein U1D30_26860 [Planctomycetota bacterium]
MAQAQFMIPELQCDPNWDDCQKKQMKSKVASLNAEAKKGNLKRRPITPALARVKESWQAKYRRGTPGAWPSFSSPTPSYAHPCAQTNGKPLDADHVIDCQWGGATPSVGNAKGPFQFLDASVNRSIGSQMAKVEDDEPSEFALKGCD